MVVPLASHRLPAIRDLLESVSELVTARLPAVLAVRRNIRYKADGSPVTSSDELLEGLIRDHLAHRLPDLAFIGEETFDDSQPSLQGHVALLDPIDGTENFCSGMRNGASRWESGTGASTWAAS